jgi:hypothetical protein
MHCCILENMDFSLANLQNLTPLERTSAETNYQPNSKCSGKNAIMPTTMVRSTLRFQK